MSTGAITSTLLHVRAVLADILTPFGWEVSTADTPFQKFHALAADGDKGHCVVSWKGDTPLGQANRTLVIKASIAVTLAARGDLFNPALGKLQGDGARLFEIHDRVKGAMLAMSLPEVSVPEPGAEVALYGGSVPLVSPDGIPLDAIEQTWEVELAEVFDAENQDQDQEQENEP